MKSSLRNVIIPLLLIVLIAWFARREYEKDLTKIIKYIDSHDDLNPMMIYTLLKDAGVKIDMTKFIDGLKKQGRSKVAIKNYIKSL